MKTTVPALSVHVRGGATVAAALLGLAASGPPLRAQDAPSPAWRTQLELGFNGARGNSSFAVLRTGFMVTHLRTDAAEVEAAGLFRYGESEGETIASDWKASIKVDLTPTGAWSPFVFATAAGDEVRRIDLRSEGGAGAKYTFWNDEGGEASLSLASLYSYEDYEQEPELASLPAEHSARWSLRARGRKRFGEGSEFQHTTFYQPVWNRAGDFVATAATTVSTSLLGDLTLAVEHEYVHDATPPPDIERDDHRMSVVFRYVF
jgi:hypothetical protein